MPSIALNELRRSKNALKPIFLSSLLISIMIFSAAHVLSLLLGNLRVYQDDISSMVYNYSIIVDTISFTIFFTTVAIIMGLFASCIFSIQYIERRRTDISVLKSTGASQNHIKTFFMIPLLVHVTLGTVIAAIASFITLNLTLPITGNLGPVYYLVVIGFSIGNIGVVAGTIYLKIFWLTKRTVTNLLGKSYNRDYLKARRRTPFTRIFGKSRRYFLLAYKNLKTRKHGFSRIFMILSLICTIVGTVFTASFVIGGTYKSFLRNGMGGDKYQATVIIGHEDITNGIMDAYKSFYIPSVNPSFPNATNNSIYEMNTTLFNQSLVEFETLQLDWRIVDYCEIEEEQGYIIDGSTGQYETIGDHRKASAIVFGVNPSTVFNEWDDGHAINLIDNTTLIVGDSIAGLMIDNIAYQKVKIMNESYNIGARVFDSIANGFSVYMHASELRESLELNPEFFNCGFGQLTTIDQALLQYQVDLLDDHVKSIYNSNFTVKLIGPIFQETLASISPLTWFTVLIALITLLFSLLFQVEQVKIIIATNRQDLRIMHSLGAKIGKLRRIIYFEFFMTLVASVFFAFAVNLIVNSLFLIRNAILPSILLPIGISSLIFLVLTCSNWIYIRIFARNLLIDVELPRPN